VDIVISIKVTSFLIVDIVISIKVTSFLIVDIVISWIQWQCWVWTKEESLYTCVRWISTCFNTYLYNLRV